jgi:protein-S-isoprenylcysteine O-methyltransferase Ste14
MSTLNALIATLLAIWCVNEITIVLISFRNRSKGLSGNKDKFSRFIVWLSTVPPVALAILLLAHPGFGSFQFPPLSYVGCLLMALGITLRLVAVATLKRQFTVNVSIVKNHEIIDSGIYGIIRHPAYLGHLALLMGIGLVSLNWISLTVLIVLPLAAILYRIHVEEAVLLRHFGPAYQAYADRTKRLLPGIW